MRKQNPFKNLIAGTILLFFLVTNFQVQAQVFDPSRNKPFMWVDGSDSHTDRVNFMKNKRAQMSRNAGSVRTYLNTSFHLPNFWKWLRYVDSTLRPQFLHVYLGIDENKKVVLVFGPAKSITEDTDHALYVFKEGTDGTKTDSIVFKDDKNRWMDSFRTAMYLTRRELSDSDNRYRRTPTSLHTPSDTRYVTYCWKDLTDLMQTKKHFEKEAGISENVRAHLAAYPMTGVRRGPNHGRFKNRILLYFDFLDAHGAEIDLDRFESFRNLDTTIKSNCPKLNKIYDTKGKKKALQSNDNGQLCPTTCD